MIGSYNHRTCHPREGTAFKDQGKQPETLNPKSRPLQRKTQNTHRHQAQLHCQEDGEDPDWVGRHAPQAAVIGIEMVPAHAQV